MDTSVVIAGAGPTGLMLAAELRLAGVGVIVLEQLGEPTGESRGIGFTLRTAEIFDQRGILRRFGELETSAAGHFGGIPLDLGVLGAEHGAARTVPQSVTESVLVARAKELGAWILRGREVARVEQTDESVTVSTSDGSSFTGRYLIGCDGGRSTVRKATGFDFPGTAATTELFLADLRGVNLPSRMTADQVAGGMVMTAKLPGGVHRIVVGERGVPPRRRAGPPSFGEVADVWKRLTGVDIAHAEPVWLSAFGDAARQVTEYRRGRVLLAGDAAHVHLPAGGQGMNTGIQDAYNLGWKLAAVLRGHAPESLVDSYHEERHEVGRRLLANTRAQSLLILGGEETDPLRQVLQELTTHPEVARDLAARASGLDIRYAVGAGANPLLGARMPQLSLTRRGRDTSVFELLRRARGLLLDFEDNPVLRERVAGWTDRVDVVTAPARGAGTASLQGTSAVLIRPDGYVAWAAPGTHHDLPAALNRWFGPAR